jgi:hypothetical protein
LIKDNNGNEGNQIDSILVKQKFEQVIPQAQLEIRAFLVERMNYTNLYWLAQLVC